MHTQTDDLIVAAFPSVVQAKLAVDELHHAGFRPDQLGIMAPDGSIREGTTPTTVLEDRATEGSLVGALAGSVLGVGIGALTVIAVPAFGAVVAGGIVSALLGSAALGATLGSVLGPFIAMGLSEDEAKFYAGKFRSGNPILVVRPEDRREEAWEILRRNEGEAAPPPAALVGGAR